ncbi:cytochrome b561 [Novimethylophilus kurashikiensis]|uniref:Cytochrome b561 n=1 Tax=Novimethylophilus kurashikiensis TaxID=1825523 RepID=A0A2R5FAQ2_9PROT|nr:cytochrome b [Novimethylophilus kurashikiensis]GBG15310.1 cytochrome b561 [Novimethylophilus kurashikiensis]
MSEAIQKYSKPAILLHWLIALLIFALFALGLFMGDLPKDAPKSTTLDLFNLGIHTMQFNEAISPRTFYFNLHKSLGFTVVILLVLRIVVRLKNGVPAFPSNMTVRDIKMAEHTHKLLYALMLGVLVAGLGNTYLSKYGLNWFGVHVFSGVDNPDMRHLFVEAHEFLAWALMAGVALHIAAALKHKFVDKDQIMQRMTFR